MANACPVAPISRLHCVDVSISVVRSGEPQKSILGAKRKRLITYLSTQLLSSQHQAKCSDHDLNDAIEIISHSSRDKMDLRSPVDSSSEESC